eukprot:CAMPEP_0172905308 /NCGR_PEP_ID=MMETSP1075-20121228/174377_1 /TAXON_ID=2916 /ORGANISM="Ceratium fusus, Strain PA161109" /LENGTH=46 /DNA_ID= /DNA_START= /DNA_END= /DNA_ORIENTATION=
MTVGDAGTAVAGVLATQRLLLATWPLGSKDLVRSLLLLVPAELQPL